MQNKITESAAGSGVAAAGGSYAAFESLMPLPIWGFWREEPNRNDISKLTKVPYQNNYEKASSENPKTWRDFNTAGEANMLADLDGFFQYRHGIALFFSDVGSGNRTGGIDLDSCRNHVTGEIEPWAKSIIAEFSSYTEVSPSGTGVKIFFLYDATSLPEFQKIMGTQSGKQFKRGGGEHPPAIEIYLCSRYFAVTGQALRGYETIASVHAKKLIHLIRVVGPGFKDSRKQNDVSALHTEVVDSRIQRIDVEPGSFLHKLYQAQDKNSMLRHVLERLDTPGRYGSRSEGAFALAGAMKAAGFSYDHFAAVILEHPSTREWAESKGILNKSRELKRAWENAKDSHHLPALSHEGARDAFGGEPSGPALDAFQWGEPDMSIVEYNDRPPPTFPKSVFGVGWEHFLTDAAVSACAPLDYAAMALIAATSTLIGNSLWPMLKSSEWTEPPHLWLCLVGESGSGKTPAAAPIMGEVLAELERRMQSGYQERLAAWETKAQMHAALMKLWEKAIDAAAEEKKDAPDKPAPLSPKPEKPRLRTNDVTVEKVASLLTSASPKGILIVQDEIAGWILRMEKYSHGDRAFWLQCWNGQQYIVDRVKNPIPVTVEICAVSVFGGTQPDKLSEMLKDAGDGLFARFIFSWPHAIKFKVANVVVDKKFAINSLDRLRLIEMLPSLPGCAAKPNYIPLEDSCIPILESFVQRTDELQRFASVPYKGAFGKTRGIALRLSLIIEMLRWCAEPTERPPSTISAKSFAAACDVILEYFLPMAERAYGDSSLSAGERDATALGLLILKNQLRSVHVTDVIRKGRISSLKRADAIHRAAATLVQANWLKMPKKGDQNGRAPQIYDVNPILLNRFLNHDLQGAC